MLTGKLLRCYRNKVSLYTVLPMRFGMSRRLEGYRGYINKAASQIRKVGTLHSTL